MQQLELNLWEVLKEAAQEPEMVELGHLFQTLESALCSLNPYNQLQVAAEAIAQIVHIFEVRSQVAFEDLANQTNGEGPILPLDFFDRFVRQSMQVDLAQFIESTVFLLPRAKQERQSDLSMNGESLVGAVDKATLLKVLEQVEQDETVTKQEVLAVAHEEDVSAWVDAIVAYLQLQGKPAVSLQELVQNVQYPVRENQVDHGTPLVKTWLTLLLGRFELEQQGEFYSSDIWVRNGCKQ